MEIHLKKFSKPRKNRSTLRGEYGNIFWTGQVPEDLLSKFPTQINSVELETTFEIELVAVVFVKEKEDNVGQYIRVVEMNLVLDIIVDVMDIS